MLKAVHAWGRNNWGGSSGVEARAFFCKLAKHMASRVVLLKGGPKRAYIGTI